MRNLIWRGGWIVALLAVTCECRRPVSRAEEDFLQNPVNHSTREGVLVLKTGQLVLGKLSQTAGGYVVELPKGSFLVPFERVSVVATDSQEAYRKLKAKQPNPTPDFQVALARWCMAWKLFAEARIELRDALVAEPDHEEARQMYVRLQELMNPGQSAIPQPETKSRDGFQQANPESLAGLSPDLARDYVTRVQPLLLNRCGNAACHGPASGQAFRITHIHSRLNRQTLLNLENVLRFVNVTQPEESPLLKAPSGAHGRNSRPIFYGSQGENNLETLKDWIYRVARETTDEETPKTRNAFARRDSFATEPDETLIRGVAEPPTPLTPEQQSERQKEDLLESIIKSEHQDAFDPEVFNRQYGS